MAGWQGRQGKGGDTLVPANHPQIRSPAHIFDESDYYSSSPLRYSTLRAYSRPVSAPSVVLVRQGKGKRRPGRHGSSAGCHHLPREMPELFASTAKYTGAQATNAERIEARPGPGVSLH